MITVRKAVNSDVNRIKTLLHPFFLKGLILDRSEAEITAELERFYIAEENSILIGTVSYHDYGKLLKEIRSLVISEQKQKSGTGSLLVKTVITDIIKDSPDAKIFTLTYVPGFFTKLGFSKVDKNTLPEKIWKDCNNCLSKDHCGETALVYVRS